MPYLFPDGFHPNQYLNKKIALLGGSFNPAHEGHLELSIQSKRYYNFDEIWWVINPQNPLKPKNIVRPFQERFDHCLEITKKYSFIKPCPIEHFNQTNMTFQLVDFLKTYYPKTKFLWLMGSDLICQMHQWEYYEKLIQNFSMIIYYRRTHFYHIKNTPILNQLKDQYVSLSSSKQKLFLNQPKWTIFPYLHNQTSSTEIRKNMVY